MITTFSTNLLPSPNLYYNSHYEKILATGEIKCIDDEIPFEIPNTWQWTRMGNVGSWGAGSTPQRGNHEYYNNGTVLWLKTGELNNDVVYDTSEKITEKALKECSLRLNKIGDVLIAMYGATIGKIAIVGKEMTTNQACCGCSPYNGLYNRYLFFYLMANKTTFIKQGEGGAQPNISRDKLVNFLIPIPPLNEQKRIAQKIEEIQPLIEKYRVSQGLTEEMDKSLNGLLKKSILQYAIQGKLVPQIESEESASILLEKIQQEKLKLVKEGKLKKKDLDNSVIIKGDDNKYYEKLGSKTTEITEEIPYELPNKWTFVRLSNLCWLDDGTKASGEKLPYLDAKYHRGKSEITYLTQGKVVEPPCKAILVDGENSGEIFNITEKGYLGSTFKVLQISKCISEEWLHILLNTYRDLFKNSKVGAAIPHLNKNLFRNLIVGVPPIEEQQRITDKIEKLMKGIEGL